MNKYFNENEVRRSIEVLHPDGELFEIRIFSGSGKKGCISGYFTDADTAIRELNKQNLEGATVCITLNCIDTACYAREQRDKFVYGPKSTSDGDIIGREWILIDLDPERKSGVSSSDEERKEAYGVFTRLYKDLQKVYHIDQDAIVAAESGNGYHLLIHVRLSNSDENTELVKGFLKELNLVYGNDKVKVDCSTFNLARVVKLYGTMAQKGASTADRPHRMSRLLSKAVRIKDSFCDITTLKQSPIHWEDNKAAAAKVASGSKKKMATTGTFDLKEWLDFHNIGYTEHSFKDGTKYVLDECPFDSTHTAPDSALFQTGDGTIGFFCFHDSCRDKTWQDVRKLFDGEDVYEKRQREYSPSKTMTRNSETTQAKIKQGKNVVAQIPKNHEERRSMFVSDAEYYDEPEEIKTFARTGFDFLDSELNGGFAMGELTVISGTTGSGKSTANSQMINQFIDDGHKVCVISGELGRSRFFEWNDRQALGDQTFFGVQTLQKLDTGDYEPVKDFRPYLKKWRNGNLLLYKNEFGFNVELIKEVVKQMISEEDSDIIVIDNMMCLDLNAESDDKWDAQKHLMWDLHLMAQEARVHIIVCCHPKKPTGLLDIYSISGSSDISNSVDNIIFFGRINDFFKRMYNKTYGRNYSVPEGKEKNPPTNYCTVAKSRGGRASDEFYNLWYEFPTKRFLTYPGEQLHYRWEDYLWNDEDNFVKTARAAGFTDKEDVAPVSESKRFSLTDDEFNRFLDSSDVEELDVLPESERTDVVNSLKDEFGYVGYCDMSKLRNRMNELIEERTQGGADDGD